MLDACPRTLVHPTIVCALGIVNVVVMILSKEALVCPLACKESTFPKNRRCPLSNRTNSSCSILHFRDSHGKRVSKASG